MNDTINCLLTRRSIRKYKNDMPSKDDIDLIVKSGLYAASGMNRQSVIILAVTDRALRNKIAESNRKIMGASEGTDPFYGAPIVLVVLANKDIPTHIYDGSLAIGNMMNAAHSLGLGSCWIHRAKEEFEQPYYKKLLSDHGISGNYEGIGHCILGYADCELPEPQERDPGRVIRI